MESSTVAVLGVVATGVLLVCSAFFSSSETAIFSLSTEWVEQQSTTGDRRAQLLRTLRDDPHRLLVTLLVGNNVVNIAISSIVTVLIASYLPPGVAIAATTLLTSCLVLIFGEIVPKAYGLGNAENWSLRVASPIRLVERALSPIITVFDAITRRISALITADPDIEKPYTE
ncbi:MULTISPECIES: CNNM domain-containing protein [Haloprofundus]|uniref:CNNM domain-containing protein n=1 Tax=Haloprofundus TaxID=1911573 RepID=UPI000E44C124|nr:MULTISPECIES: DUF21 domain-containing protein [Haloprofundus]QCJ45776.1 DUF21 domain-containing protein [Haloprofundus sp. MHR1]